MRTLELASTGLEGLEYVNTHNLEGKFEQTMTVFIDVIQAFLEIERVLVECGMADILNPQTQTVKDGFEWMVKSYAGSASNGSTKMMQATVLPRYIAWQEALRTSLCSYIEC